ncbi:MAG: glycosyltransferase family 2 protein [Candidatus Shapirobacteria bacterium]|nr:glycosyltransferase family 2 protein [Candidatus Shapirobacteria bacterium]
MKKEVKLSVIVISGNAEETIGKCLESLRFADENVLVLANSTDKSKAIALKTIPKIKITETKDEYNKNFSKWRNMGYKLATGKWILYVDTDEVVTEELQKEILDIVNGQTDKSYYVIPRANYFLGKRVKYGNTYPDYVKRLYLRKDFGGYTGVLHEEPVIKGQMGYLKNDLLHYTHRDLHSMLDKTNSWTDMEAEALFEAKHPPVVWWRFPRMMLTKFWERAIKQQMWKDGTVGWISVIFEMFDTFVIYAKLYELQQKKTG